MWVTPSDTLSLERRISGEEGVDEYNLVGEIEPESGMAEPGDLHGKPSLSVFKMGRDRRPTTWDKELKSA
jgi:hypothetical protein